MSPLTLRTAALVGTCAWAIVALSGHLAPASAAPVHSSLNQVYPDSTSLSGHEIAPALAHPMPQKMHTWDNVVISRKIGDCGNRCRAGIAE
jgi:hypothetical protein